MDSLWSWSDKHHRVRIPAKKWTRLTFIDDETLIWHEGGTVKEKVEGATVQGQLYTGCTIGTDFISARFGRKFPNGHIDWTGYQDWKAPTSKRTFNLAPIWVGDLLPGYSFIIDVRSNKEFVMGNHIYKGKA